MKLLRWFLDHPWKTLVRVCFTVFCATHLCCTFMPSNDPLMPRHLQIPPAENAVEVLHKHDAEISKIYLSDNERLGDREIEFLNKLNHELKKCTGLKDECQDPNQHHLRAITYYIRLNNKLIEQLNRDRNNLTASQILDDQWRLIWLKYETRDMLSGRAYERWSSETLSRALALSSKSKITKNKFKKYLPNPDERYERFRNQIAIIANPSDETIEFYHHAVEIATPENSHLKKIDPALTRLLIRKKLSLVLSGLDSNCHRSSDSKWKKADFPDLNHATGEEHIASFVASCQSHDLKKFIAFETALRLHQTRCACLDYMDTHGGQPPPDLDTLVKAGLLKEIPIDPWDGKPLRYDATRGILWSVGDNLTDEGGKANGKFSVLLGEEVPDLCALSAGNDVVLPLKLKTVP